MVKNILITGGAGFIGSNLALQLLDKGYHITVLDNLSRQIHGVDGEASESFLLIKDKVRFVKGDVCSDSDWATALKGQDAIIHLAAETGTGQSMYEIEKYVNVNIRGTAVLLDYLGNQKHNIKRVLVASSRAIYGEGKYCCGDHNIVYPLQRSSLDLSQGNFEPRCPICNSNIKSHPTDEDSLIQPTSIYGITKQNQEQMILLGCKNLNISAIAFRYQNVYGPGQSLSNPYTGILSVFSTRILNNNPIEIFEDGLETRDFVYIDDVIRATILGLELPGEINEAFNVGSGNNISVFEVAKILKEKYQSSIEINISGRFRAGDIRHNFADLSKIKKIGFSPLISFEEGIDRFVKWVKTQDLKQDDFDQSIDEMEEKGLLK